VSGEEALQHTFIDLFIPFSSHYISTHVSTPNKTCFTSTTLDPERGLFHSLTAPPMFSAGKSRDSIKRRAFWAEMSSPSGSYILHRLDVGTLATITTKTCRHEHLIGRCPSLPFQVVSGCLATSRFAGTVPFRIRNRYRQGGLLCTSDGATVTKRSCAT
jgi:hypothetical protein